MTSENDIPEALLEDYERALQSMSTTMDIFAEDLMVLAHFGPASSPDSSARKARGRSGLRPRALQGLKGRGVHQG